MLLSACRLDVDVSVVMEPDGTGTVTVEATADAELIAQVPDLADDLRLEDAIANGWTATGPTPDGDGALTIVLTHPFSSAEELASVLNSIGPPFSAMAAARTTQDELTSNAINGNLVLPDGFASFADADLMQAVGGLPFGDQITASGLSPSQAMSFTFQVALPGDLVVAAEGTEVSDGVIRWEAPLDGSSLNVLTQTVQRPASETRAWAGPVSKAALVALILWVLVAAAFLTFVAIARRRKQRRRNRALRKLG